MAGSGRVIRAWVAGALGVSAAGAGSGAVWFVDASAPAGGTGASWTAALRSPVDALAASLPGDEVRVAQGVYRSGAPGASRDSAFVLPTGVALRGGYAGLAGANPDARDTSAFVTTLNGDLNGDDAPAFANRGDNAYHVVHAGGLTADATLDGVRIVGGNADGPLGGEQFRERGGGVLAQSAGAAAGRLRLIDCLLEDNSARVGGGAATWDANIRAEGTTFRANRALFSGGGFGDQTNLVSARRFEFVGCRFSQNFAVGFAGGGIVAFGIGYTLAVSGCAFEGNSAAGGGGVYTTGSGNHARAVNCVFTGNVSSSGPAWFDDHTVTIRVVNCTMTGNMATSASGVASVVRLIGLDSLVSNCIVQGNTAGQGAITGLNTVAARASNLQCFAGGGAGVIDEDPRFRDAGAGDFRLRRGSPCVDSGLNADVTPDEFDLDGDGNTAEATPRDFGGGARFVDDPAAAPNGAATADMGALERAACAGDANDDLQVTFADLNVVLSQFGQSGAIGALAGDLTGDGSVTFADLNLVLSGFGAGC